MNRIVWTGIIAVLSAGMAFGQGMAPKALAEAQKAAKEKESENSRAVFQDQLRRTETRGTITGRFAITQPAGSHFRASIEVWASDGRVEVNRVAFGEAGGWTHTDKTAEFKVEGVPLQPGVSYWIVIRASTCPLTHVFKPTPKSDVPGYWDPQECKGKPMTGKGTDFSRIPVTFGNQNTVDVGEIAVEPGTVSPSPAPNGSAAANPPGKWPADGKRHDSYEIPKATPVAAIPPPPNPALERLTVGLQDSGRVVAAEHTSGKTVWQVKLPAPASAVQVEGNRVIVQPAGLVLDLATGKAVQQPTPDLSPDQEAIPRKLAQEWVQANGKTDWGEITKIMDHGDRWSVLFTKILNQATPAQHTAGVWIEKKTGRTQEVLGE
jgi:hypothetical protein